MEKPPLGFASNLHRGIPASIPTFFHTCENLEKHPVTEEKKQLHIRIISTNVPFLLPPFSRARNYSHVPPFTVASIGQIPFRGVLIYINFLAKILTVPALVSLMRGARRERNKSKYDDRTDEFYFCAVLIIIFFGENVSKSSSQRGEIHLSVIFLSPARKRTNLARFL